jgi:hypothetical protein
VICDMIITGGRACGECGRPAPLDRTMSFRRAGCSEQFLATTTGKASKVIYKMSDMYVCI